MLYCHEPFQGSGLSSFQIISLNLGFEDAVCSHADALPSDSPHAASPLEVHTSCDSMLPICIGHMYISLSPPFPLPFLHMLSYSSNGEGIWLFEIVAEGMLSFKQQ